MRTVHQRYVVDETHVPSNAMFGERDYMAFLRMTVQLRTAFRLEATVKTPCTPINRFGPNLFHDDDDDDGDDNDDDGDEYDE